MHQTLGGTVLTSDTGVPIKYAVRKTDTSLNFALLKRHTYCVVLNRYCNCPWYPHPLTRHSSSKSRAHHTLLQFHMTCEVPVWRSPGKPLKLENFLGKNPISWLQHAVCGTCFQPGIRCHDTSSRFVNAKQDSRGKRSKCALCDGMKCFQAFEVSPGGA